jgi:hypothetical protein
VLCNFLGICQQNFQQYAEKNDAATEVLSQAGVVMPLHRPQVLTVQNGPLGPLALRRHYAGRNSPCNSRTGHPSLTAVARSETGPVVEGHPADRLLEWIDCVHPCTGMGGGRKVGHTVLMLENEKSISA